ncbi:MAG: phage terminase small subunit P27 family [Rickettsiales bacterium]|nr:phage terminase small subunit P27 family [Rickettsiales bacterium]|tara:strand:- start:408 stop:920 length:513 start_codon:yes stop_codon:yes gene_type:complete
MAGRKRKPTNIKLVTGNPGRRPLKRSEPAPKTGKPSRPAHMSKRAKLAWPKFIKMLGDMDVLTLADAAALEALCETYADLLEARESLSKPLSYFDKDGNEKIICPANERTYLSWSQHGVMARSRPELATISDAHKRLMSALAEFGLTPAARSRVQANTDGNKKDELEDFF